MLCRVATFLILLSSSDALRSLQGQGSPPNGQGPPPDGQGGGGGGATTCSSNVQRDLGSQGTSEDGCLAVSMGDSLSYPEDFTIKNQVKHYTCPTSGVRIIVSNGIPDHDIVITNPNAPCAQEWMIKVPLEPAYVADANSIEPSSLGFIAMSLNGVPAYGAQEGGGFNAVEQQDGSDFEAVPYFGHAAPNGDWHYHSGEFGRTTDLELGELTSETLLGYAADGFPIYGPLDDASVLDECNGIQTGDTVDTYRYHVLKLSLIDENGDYCDGESPAVTWKYILGCFRGDLSNSSISDASTEAVPDDCELVGSSDGMDGGDGDGTTETDGDTDGTTDTGGDDTGDTTDGDGVGDGSSGSQLAVCGVLVSTAMMMAASTLW